MGVYSTFPILWGLFVQLDFPDQHIEENISSVLGGVVNHRGNLPKCMSHCKKTFPPPFSVPLGHFVVLLEQL